MKKRIIICIYILLFFLSMKLAFCFIYNENIISKYENGEYSINIEPLFSLNYFQPYLAHYNKGNLNYQKGKYDDAIEEYKKALQLKPDKKRECSVRINLALAIINTMDSNYDEEENVEESISILEEAKGILLEDDCATLEGDGHNSTAEKLKDEIDLLLDELKENQEVNENNTNVQNNTDEHKEKEYEQSIKEKLQQQQNDSFGERKESMEIYDMFDYEFDFDSDGRIW